MRQLTWTRFLIVLSAVAFMTTTTGLAVGQDAKRAPARYGTVIGLRPEKIAEYKKLHAAIWPEIAKANHEANVRNYSIYLRKLPDGNYYLFSYFEYVGNDFAADMKRMKTNPDVKRWWSFTDPCQKPLALTATRPCGRNG
jgi:L-rhamnose mutarotase